MATAMKAAGPETRLSSLASLTTRVFNPVMRQVAGWFPGLGILTHHGRRTGKVYRTPVLVLRRGNRYLIALWYGPSVQWVQNVLVQGSAELETRRRMMRLDDPEVLAGAAREQLPWLLRFGARLIGVNDVLEFHAKRASS